MRREIFGYHVDAGGMLRSTPALQSAGIKGLRQAKADLLREMGALRDTLRDENRAMTEQERATFTGLERAIDHVQTQLTIRETEAAAERRQPVHADPDAEAARRAQALAGIVSPVSFEGTAAQRPGGPLTYASLFGAQAADAASLDGWSDPSEIFRVLSAGLNDPRLRAAGQGGESDPHGGYAIPTALEVAIFDGAVPASIFLRRATVRPMTARQQDVATFDRSNDGANGTMFGIGLEFIAEGGDGANVQTAKLRMISMTAHTGAVLFDASNELLQDASGFEGGLMQAVRLATGYGIDRVCIRGTGVGQPLGVRNLPALITVDPEGGQGADTILYANLTKMFARLPTSSISNSVWLASPSTIPQLAALTIPIGTGGSHVPVMTSRDGKFEILTREVLFTDLVPPLGDAGDISLVDLSQYVIGMRAGMALDKSAHVGFAKNRTTFRLLLRFDGSSGWDKPFQPESSAPTQSPFVQLGAR